MSLPLPSHPGFGPYRESGADLVAANQEVLDSPIVAAGEHSYSIQLQLPSVFRGSVDSQGHPTTILRFTKSLYDLFGQGTSGPSDSPGYSWPSGSGKGALVKVVLPRSILCNVMILLPERTMSAHHYEWGWHGLYVGGTNQLLGWNIKIINAENALILGGAYSHLEDVTVDWTPGRKPNSEGKYAHYGVTVGGHHNVLDGYRCTKLTHHDVDIQGCDHCAVLRASGYDLNLSYHAHSTDEEDDHNLIAWANLGKATRRFTQHGSSSNKPWTGDYSSFYDLRNGQGDLLPKSIVPSWIQNPVWIPVSSDVPTPPPEVPMFAVGDTVQATDLIKVRSEPKKTSALLSEHPAGTQTTIQSPTGVLDAVSHIVYSNTALGGYVGEDRLVKVAFAPVLTARQRAEQKLVGLGLTSEEAASL